MYEYDFNKSLIQKNIISISREVKKFHFNLMAKEIRCMRYRMNHL